MTDQIPTEGRSSFDTKRRGIYLPSMTWTEDRQAVEQEKQRLLVFQQQLATFVRAAQASDESGRQLEFSNVSLSGGFQAAYADTRELRESHVCFIRGIRCWADEARFGGIVIQTQDATNVA